MCDARRLLRRRKAFTLIELLVVMFMILAIAAIGVGYVVFGQDNQHSVTAANAVTGALLNAKGRARQSGVPTGIRILFGANGQASQLVLVQQPDSYTAGVCQGSTGATQTLGFSGTVQSPLDFQGGAQYMGQIDQSTVQAGDYFTAPGLPTAHLITQVSGTLPSPPNIQSITLASAVGPLAPGSPYAIVRGPRRLPSEDIIQLPPNIIIDSSVYPQPAGPNSIALCQNVPQRTLTDSNNPNGVSVAEIVFSPSGALTGQGTGADKVLLWLHDPSLPTPLSGQPLIVSVQVRTGLISVYPVGPWNPSQPYSVNVNDPFTYAKDGHASGM